MDISIPLYLIKDNQPVYYITADKVCEVIKKRKLIYINIREKKK